MNFRQFHPMWQAHAEVTILSCITGTLQEYQKRMKKLDQQYKERLRNAGKLSLFENRTAKEMLLDIEIIF